MQNLKDWLLDGAWIPGLELALVGALALVLAQVTLVFVSPPAIGVAGEALQQDRSAAAAGGLFGASSVASSAQGAPRLRLLGVAAGREGVAIIAVDNARPRAVALGETIVSGWVLSEVHPDHVLVARDGSAERVVLERRRTAPANGSR